MDEKILILMEETSCEQAEAELALELANYDLEKAIRTIRSILRNIIVIKGKFIIAEKNLYGLFIMIINKRSETAIRLRCVTSYNPMICESDLNTDWDQVERLIYRYRLIEGSVLSLAHNIENHFSQAVNSKKEKFYKSLDNKSLDKTKDILIENFPLGIPEIQIVTEEINLADYQDGSSKTEPEKLTDRVSVRPELTKISLDVKLYEDINGKKAANLSKGDIVLAQITDSREVAKYLTKLLCSKDPIYLPVSIEEINCTDSKIEISLHFTPRIVGFTRLKQNTRIKVIKEVSSPWWKRIFPWVRLT
jgi:hypothetical protein